MSKDPRFYWNDSRFVPSGTTVLPEPDLKRWSADCVIRYLQDNPIYDENGFKKARNAHNQESMEAADYGTYIHKLCEVSLTNDIQIESPHELTNQFMQGLWDWKTKHKVVPIVMEYEVTSIWYGGRLDLVCEMDSYWMTKAWCEKYGVEWYKGIDKQRVIVLVDFKTGKSSYYETWKYQLAGYRQAYNQNICYTSTGANITPYYTVHDVEQQGLIQHHGILKFNKQTGKVNYKDFTIYDATRYKVLDKRKENGKLETEKYIRNYETDRRTFNLLVKLWWSINQGELK